MVVISGKDIHSFLKVLGGKTLPLYSQAEADLGSSLFVSLEWLAKELNDSKRLRVKSKDLIGMI